MAGVHRRTGQGAVDRLVRRRRLLLPADRVQEELPVGVVVDHESEAEPGGQPHQGLRLRFGPGSRSPEGLISRKVEDPTGVKPQWSGRFRLMSTPSSHADLPVVVVVGEVLAPQPVVGLEGEFVTVGVGRHDEPQLGGIEEAG